MAVYFSASNPAKLLREFDTAVRAKEGSCARWCVSRHETAYTIESSRWGQRAWMRTQLASNVLTFNIYAGTDEHVSAELYAQYHAELVRTFLSQFSHLFSMTGATAAPAAGDCCSA